MKKRITFGHIMIVIFLLVLSLVSLYPLWYTIIISFSEKTPIDAGRVWIVPIDFTLGNYQRIIEDMTFFSAFMVSVKRVVVGVSINMLLLVLTAFPLCLPRKHFPEGNIYKWFFISNMLFSGGMIPAYMLIREYHLINSFWAMILPGAVPLWNVVLMINFFRNVPYELFESANMDGANPLVILFKIYIPLSIPSLACIFLFQFLGHWNSYFDGLIYINEQVKQPLQTYIYQMSLVVDLNTLTAEEAKEVLKLSDKALQSAKIITALIPVMMVYPFIQKYFTTGMTMGAVKG